MRIVDQQIFFGDATAKLHDFHIEAVHANALVAILAEHQRLAMFELNDVFAAGFTLGEREPRAIVKNIAVLQNLDEGGASVSSGVLEGFFQVALKDVDGAGDESGFGADG